MYFKPLKTVVPTFRQTVSDTTWDKAQSARKQVIEMRDALVELRHQLLGETKGLRKALMAGSAIHTSITPVALASSSSLGLDLTSTPARLVPTQEVNTAPTSYSPFGPSFSGASTSLPTLNGVYNGAQGNNTLTFRVTRPGNVGGPYTRIIGLGLFPADLRVEVRNGGGGLITNIDFTEATAPGTVFNLPNGLNISFSAGSLVNNNTFQVDVSTTVPSSVISNNPFNGTRNLRPNFDLGKSVTAGTFEINGTAIAVNANDTLDAVLSRITDSAAGVTATYDAATDKVLLAQKTPGAAGAISLGADTTGFFSAVKLTEATLVAGEDNDLDAPVANVAALSGISSGTFSINGVNFSIDTARDSLSEIISRINGGGAGVVASYTSDKIHLSPQTPSGSVILADGTSQFFSALGITPGTYEAEIETSEISVTRRGGSDRLAEALTTRMTDINQQLQALFSTLKNLAKQGEENKYPSAFRQAVRDAFSEVMKISPENVDNNPAVRLQTGFELRDTSSHFGGFAFDATAIRNALQQRPNRVLDLLLNEKNQNGSQGMLAAMTQALDEIAEDLVRRLGPGPGRLLDVAA